MANLLKCRCTAIGCHPEAGVKQNACHPETGAFCPTKDPGEPREAIASFATQ
jgi:hypothetical protein